MNTLRYLRLSAAMLYVSRIIASVFLLQMAGSIDAAPSRLYFNHYNTSNGLSQNSVNYLMQDKQGFIWVATKDGLNRFDGFNFLHIDTDSGAGCTFATTIFQDDDGLIWTGAHNGAFTYNPASEHLEKFNILDANGNSINKPVIQFLSDRNGNILLVVDSEGVWRYDKKADRMNPIYSSSSIKVNQLVIDPRGRMWVGTFGQGLLYSDDNLRTLKTFRSEDSSFDFGNAIISHLLMKGDKLYVATDRLGVHAIDVRTGSAREVFSKDEKGNVPYIRQVMFDAQDFLFIATEEGIFVYDVQADRLSQHLTHNVYDKYSISDNAVYALLNDREDGVWVGTYFGGVDYNPFKKMCFDKYYPDNSSDALNGQRIRELCENPADGNIFIGTEDHGLFIFNSTSGKFRPMEGISSKNIHALCIDDNHLWIGTFAEGLHIKELSSGRVKRYSAADGLGNDYIFSIIRTLHGDMMVGTMGGLYSYDRKTDSFQNIPELTNIFVYDIMEDNQGNLWVATYDHGLYMRKAGHSDWHSWKWNPSDADGIPSDKIYGLYQDPLSTIWIMTQDGLCSYSLTDNKFSRDFLGTDRIRGMVYQVIDDDYGRIWLTSNQGLYCLDRKSTDLHRFTVNSGLPSNQFNYRSALKSADGHLYFGTTEGLVAFQPINFSFSLPPVSTTISEFYLHGELIRPNDENSPLATSISMTKDLYLSSNQNTIGFRLASLNYSAIGEEGIMYRLVGYDSDWHYTNLTDALIAYPNLGYGTYTLQVAPYNEFSESESEPMELRIHIATPFYLTWWAWLLYVVATLSVIYVIFYLYRRNAQLNNQRYLENYKSEKEREAYDSKIQFFTNVAHEIRTPLTLIKAPLDCVSKSKTLSSDSDTRENLDVINMNVDRLLLLANQLLDFRKMEDGKFQIKRQPTDVKSLLTHCVTRFKPTMESAGRTLSLSLPAKPLIVNIDSEAITKIISNLFTNAIKYGSSFIDLKLESAADSGFTLIISNDGEIVSPAKREEIFTIFSRLEKSRNIPGTGIGLAYARSLAQMHGGSLRMDDSLTENTFILHIPDSTNPEREEDPAARAAPNQESINEILENKTTGVTILVADDNVEMLSFLEKKLISSGYRVLKASDGQAALELLANEYVDIVVSDVMMPDVDGIELLRRIKTDVNYSHLPVILLTAKTRMEDKLAGLDCGADAYIEKPFAIEYLLSNISMLLRNREILRQRFSSQNFTKDKELHNSLNKIDEEFLSRLNEVIQTNYSNPDFTIDDVVAILGISRTSFYRKMRGMFDVNPNDFIRIERVKRARILFDEGHRRVGEVSLMVGFSTPNYFSKCFQKHFGVTPSEYLASISTRKQVPPFHE